MALNVLVVDDSSVMRSMIIKTLRLSGVGLGDVYEAANGQQGLDVLSDNWVDLALVDINMPVMSGEEMIDRVRANPETADLSVIVVSTESSESRIDMLQKKGAGFVHKPFTPEMLREMIVGITGVSDEEQFADGALQGSGYDF
jgi:two-component system chemotaxis response regulator CheY